MTETIQKLVKSVADSRNRLLQELQPLTTEQGAFKPAADRWSIAEIAEHLVLAEHSGLSKMWAALLASREGKPIWSGENPNRSLSIDAIIAKTWKSSEIAPPIATPSWGGPLAYWLSYLASCQSVLEDLAKEIREEELDDVVYPHYLSGPLTLRQRFEFIRFHIDRHRLQAKTLIVDPNFPQTQTILS